MDARTSADAGSTLSAERLKYVTEHFHKLQGLTNVALGALFLFLKTMDLWDRLPARGWLLAVKAAALVAVSVAAFRYIPGILDYIPEYYRRRYGWVEPRNAGRACKTESIGCLVVILLFLVFVFFGRPIGRYTDSILPHPVTFLPAMLWSVYLCVSFRKNSYQEDLYRMYFLASGALAWAFTALYPIWHPDAMHPTLWKFLNDGWMGLSLIAWGLYDHLTLVRLMPRRIRNEEDDNAGI